ncbi:MAG: hypothetical protein MK227_03040 [Nitrososphaerales archaeon]|nr:hypothetical protein [Nitrososphaerales archaeon]
MKKFPLATQEIGSIRKPKWLVKLLQDKNVSNDVKEAARSDVALLNLKLFEDIGLDVIYDGEARRVEMYEYSIRRIEGLQLAGKIRSWDNKYYNKGRCTKKVKYMGPYHVDEFLFVKENANKMIKLPITGAYTLADWSYNEAYKSKEDFTIDLAKKVIRPLIKDLVKTGADFIQIDEPAATTHPDEMQLVVDSFNESIKGINAKFGIHICYSEDYSNMYPEVLEMKNHQYELEFANRDSWNKGISHSNRNGYESFLKTFKEYGEKKEIGLGVLDVHVDEVESPELVRDRLLYAVKMTDNPNLVHVNPDCGLRTRSRETSFAKLKNMVIGTEMAKKRLEL